jgi:exopolysaccharide biosynthesis polyprenyl glycosylphosphotransferase
MIHINFSRQRYLYLFVLLDLLTVAAAFYCAFYLRTTIRLPFFHGLMPVAAYSNWIEMFVPLILVGGVYALLNYIGGIYDSWEIGSALLWAKKLFLTNLLVLGLIFTCFYLIQEFSVARSIVVVFVMINFIFSIIWRVLVFRNLNFITRVTRVLLVGDLQNLMPLIDEFESPFFSNKIKIEAIFTEPHSVSSSVVKRYSVCSIAEVPSYISQNNFDSIVIEPSKINNYSETLFRLLDVIKHSVSVYILPSAYEILLGRFDHIQVGDVPLFELKLRPHDGFFLFFKRCFDIFLSLGLLVMFLLPGFMLGLLIKLTSKGSVLYTQKRVGEQGKIFKIYKFRSMVTNAEQQTGAVLATKNDRRVTKLGRFLRKARLDELPQLLNVLKGDMSFVGPRPERPEFVMQYEKEIPGYKERKRIRPGITGLAQVCGTYETTPEVKLKYDLAYLVNRGFTLDLQILARTIKTVFTRVGQ